MEIVYATDSRGARGRGNHEAGKSSDLTFDRLVGGRASGDDLRPRGWTPLGRWRGSRTESGQLGLGPAESRRSEFERVLCTARKRLDIDDVRVNLLSDELGRSPLFVSKQIIS